MNEKKVVLITGTSRGLGHTLAQTMASEGFCVYAGSRNTNSNPEGTISVNLDLSDEKSLESCVNKIIHEKGKVDILINNAAVAYYGAVDSLTLKEARELFEVNFFGTFRLTQLILPYMRKMSSGKIIFISSIRGVESCAYMGMYAASKAALEAIAFDWAVTLSKWNITVSVVQPGPLNTGIVIKHGTYFSDENQNPYIPYGEVTIEYQPLDQAVQIILENILNLTPPFRFQTSDAARNVIAKHLKDYSGIEWFNEQKN